MALDAPEMRSLGITASALKQVQQASFALRPANAKTLSLASALVGSTAAFSAAVRTVRLSLDGSATVRGCLFTVGSAPTATVSTSMFLPKGTTVEIGIASAEKISALLVPSTETGAVLYFAEMVTV